MSWSKKLPEPIRLKGNRELKTLRDAGELITGLSESLQKAPTWQYATELVLQAAQSGKQDHIKDARDQVARAASRDNLLAR